MFNRKSVLSVLIATALLVLSSGPLLFPGSPARADLLVDISTHFIDVPQGSSPEPVRLAATLYQPRFLPSAAAAIYIHGWGGRRLTGEDNLAYYVAAAGYVVLSYTARGFGDDESGGRATLAGPDELEDLSKVIDWLKDDPHNVIDPRVTKIGVVGGSYGGGHGFQISSDPRVSAVIPLVGWTDLEQSLYPNGAINYRMGIGEFYSGLQRHVGSPPFYNYTDLQFELFDAAAEGRLPDSGVREMLRVRSIAHLNGDGVETLDAARVPMAPTFIIQSWDDYLFPAAQVLDVFSQINAPRQIYLGRTGHPPEGHTFEGEELYIGTQVLRWFGRYLQGVGSTDKRTVTSAPAPFSVLPFTAQTLPSDDIASQKLFLKAGGVLLKKKKKAPAAQETAGGIFRPERIRGSRGGADIPAQSDMLSGRVESLTGVPLRLEYTLPPWTSETEMLGSSQFTLFVSSETGGDIDLIVRTYDVAPDGSETEVTVGAVRVKGLAAGQVREVNFKDYGDDWVFAPGHSLRVRISNIDFPAFRPSGANDNRPSMFTIHTGRGFLSKMTLPVRVR
jgi:predicted acyl esterase